MANLYKIFHPSIDFLSLHLNQVLFTIVPVSENRKCYLSGSLLGGPKNYEYPTENHFFFLVFAQLSTLDSPVL